MPLAGCAAAGNFVAIPSPSQTTPVASSNLTGNWQIQSGTAITSSSAGGIFLIGAVQQSGSTVTGTFTGSTICPTEQVFNLAGSVDASGNLSLAATPSPYVQVQLAIPTAATTPAIGNLTAAGQLCALVMKSPAVGVRIAPVTGTFTGAVTAATALPMQIATGSVSLSLTQSAAANTTGQFPASGQLIFTGGGCSTSAAVTGMISGEGIALASSAGVSLTGTTNPTASAITVSPIQFTPGPCGLSSSSTYAGTLTLQ
jgi:hypothetical protein